MPHTVGKVTAAAIMMDLRLAGQLDTQRQTAPELR